MGQSNTWPSSSTMTSVELDNNAMASDYRLLERTNVQNNLLGFDVRSEMERLFNLIKHSLIPESINSKDATILNIGAGPEPIVQDFITAFVPYCKKIILCEINPSFCQDYTLSQWYKLNTNKIEIINKPFEQVYNNIDIDCNEKKPQLQLQIRFDLIWCNHVLYHMRLKYIPILVKKLVNLLNTERNSYAIVGIGEDDDNFIKYTNKLITKKYGLSRYFEQCLRMQDLSQSSLLGEHCVNYDNIDWFMLRFHSRTPLNSKQHAVDLLKLFIKEDLYHHPDYNPSLKMNKQDEKKLEDTIEIALKKTFTKCENTGKYVMQADTDYYFIKTKTSTSKPYATTSKL